MVEICKVCLLEGFEVTTDPCPVTALSGAPSDVYSLNKLQRDLLACCMLLAHSLILLKWKGVIPPSHTQWIWNVLYNMRLDKSKHTLTYVEEERDLHENPPCKCDDRIMLFINSFILVFLLFYKSATKSNLNLQSVVLCGSIDWMWTGEGTAWLGSCLWSAGEPVSQSMEGGACCDDLLRPVCLLLGLCGCLFRLCRWARQRVIRSAGNTWPLRASALLKTLLLASLSCGFHPICIYLSWS